MNLQLDSFDGSSQILVHLYYLLKAGNHMSTTSGTVKTISNSLVGCIIKLAVASIAVVIGVLCGLDQGESSAKAFHIAIILQSIDTIAEYLSALHEYDGRLTKFLRNSLAVITLLQVAALIISFVCISKDWSSTFSLRIFLFILISTPCVHWCVEIAYYMK